jgi:ribokinase
MVVHSKKLPRPGETVLGGAFFMSQGGKGANQAVGASLLGGDVLFTAKVGDDMFGETSLKCYREAGLSTDYIAVSHDKPSGIALIMVDANAENCIAVAGGANLELTTVDTDRALSRIEAGDIVLLQLEIPIPTVAYVIEQASRRGARVVLNPAPAAKLAPSMLSQVFMLTPNRIEASMLTGIAINTESDEELVADRLHALGVKVVVMTLGSRGSLLSTTEGKRRFAARPVSAVDTTCAGDVFNAALCVALAEDRSFDEAVRFATAASSISVTRKGAQTSIPTRAEVDTLILKEKMA